MASDMSDGELQELGSTFRAPGDLKADKQKFSSRIRQSVNNPWLPLFLGAGEKDEALFPLWEYEVKCLLL